jgi:hypothetical protein
MEAWAEPFVTKRVPPIFDLQTDPFERGDESMFYQKWKADHTFVAVPVQGLVGQLLESFKEFPPRAKAASFSVDQVVESLMPKS